MKSLSKLGILSANSYEETNANTKLINHLPLNLTYETGLKKSITVGTSPISMDYTKATDSDKDRHPTQKSICKDTHEAAKRTVFTRLYAEH